MLRNPVFLRLIYFPSKDSKLKTNEGCKMKWNPQGSNLNIYCYQKIGSIEYIYLTNQ
jgi:hypothetical protein